MACENEPLQKFEISPYEIKFKKIFDDEILGFVGFLFCRGWDMMVGESPLLTCFGYKHCHVKYSSPLIYNGERKKERKRDKDDG